MEFCVPSSVLPQLRAFLASPAAASAFATARVHHPALCDASPVGVAGALCDRSSVEEHRDALVRLIVQLAPQSRAGTDVAVAVLAVALEPHVRRVLRRWGHDREEAEHELVLAVIESLRAGGTGRAPSFCELRAQVAARLGRQHRARGHATSSPDRLDDDRLGTTVPLAQVALARVWAIATASLEPVDLHIVGARLARGDTFGCIGAQLVLKPDACRKRFRVAHRRLTATLTGPRDSVSPRANTRCSDLLDGQQRQPDSASSNTTGRAL